jgi:AcrR family transcriptional regulator
MTITRETLIQGALAAYNTTDTDALTVDALAVTLRMSKSTLYKYFAGLDDLIYATVEHLCEATEQELSEVPSAAGAEVVFRAVAAVYGNHAARMPKTLLAFASKLPKAAQLRLENMEARLGNRMYRAALNLPKATPVTAQAVHSAFAGALRFVRTTPPDLRFDELQTVAEATLRGLA